MTSYTKWFDHLKSKGHKIVGYVIMPNHLHVLIGFIKTDQTINMIIGNGKRFMAYDIIKRLKEAQQHKLLDTQAKDVEVKRKYYAGESGSYEINVIED